jgi:hypothetical protein
VSDVIFVTGWTEWKNKEKNKRSGDSLKKKWKSEVMHGQYIRSMGRELTSEEDTSCGC